MSKLPLILLAATGLCSQALLAQTTAPAPANPPAKPDAEGKPSTAKAPSAATPTPSAKPTPSKATPAPAKTTPVAKPASPTAEPEAKKPGFFRRMFTKDKTAATPTPAPAATPTPKPKPTATPKKEAPDKPADASTAKPADKPPTGPAKTTEPTPGPGKRGSKPAAPDKKPEKTVAQPPDSTDPEVIEKWKYTQAKSTAMEDKELQELKDKADAANSEDEGRKALRTYNKALFSKMRHIDPSIKDRIDRMESALLKRLSESQ